MSNSLRIGINKTISLYSDIEVGQLDKMYSSLYELITTNSFTFDDSGEANPLVDSAADIRGMDFSNSLETMDKSEYSRYS